MLPSSEVKKHVKISNCAKKVSRTVFDGFEKHYHSKGKMENMLVVKPELVTEDQKISQK